MTLLSSLAGDVEIETQLTDAAQLADLLAFERALAAAEAEAGLIGSEAAASVVAAIDRFAPDWDGLRAGMARDGVVVPELVRQLRAGVADPHKGALHLGATSQDVIDTALMLALARIIPLLEARIVALQGQLEAMAAAHGGQALMAHTRMQAALPTTVGEKIRTWGEPLVRYLQGLAQARRSLLVVQLGGPVGDRASFGGQGDEVARLLAQKLDLGVAPAWHSTRDPIVAFGGLLALI
jgi:3-carboxy-cis,cis-muconate cycloisomerase